MIHKFIKYLPVGNIVKTLFIYVESKPETKEVKGEVVDPWDNSILSKFTWDPYLGLFTSPNTSSIIRDSIMSLLDRYQAPRSRVYYA